MRNAFTAIAALTLAAAAAQATTFSFSSDRNTDGPTLASLASGSVRDGRPFDLGGTVIVDFLYDVDEDGPAGPGIIPASFELDASVTGYAMTPFAGNFIHSWTLEGTFRFIELTSGEAFFSAAFGNALLTNFSDSPTLLAASGSLLSNSSADPALTFTTAGPLAGMDVSAGEDFSFSLSALRGSADGARVPIAADGGFLTSWKAEGSWSARAVPAPGAMALLGLGAMILARRQR